MFALTFSCERLYPVAIPETIRRAMIEIAPILSEMTQSQEIDTHIVRLAVDFKKNHPESKIPTIDELAFEVWRNKRCSCLDAIPQPDAVRVITHLLAFRLEKWRCERIRAGYEFYLLQRTMPSLEELEDVIRRHISLRQDAAQYSSDNKIEIGVSIEIYAIKDKPLADPEQICSLCSSPIGTFSYYALPCGHKFHYNKDDCLDETTIKKWFDGNTKCPLCRKDIRDFTNPPKITKVNSSDNGSQSSDGDVSSSASTASLSSYVDSSEASSVVDDDESENNEENSDSEDMSPPASPSSNRIGVEYIRELF